jgi:hypothetical protein
MGLSERALCAGQSALLITLRPGRGVQRFAFFSIMPPISLTSFAATSAV